MEPRVLKVADQMLLIERELHLLGLWSAEPPSAQALSSQQPFCVDTLAFEEWLQWIFMPRMKEVIERGLQLPAVSGIREMGEVVFVDRLEAYAGLLDLLGAFDQLIADTQR
jgi:uncharacterized protein YqcC (DUF446 family)